MSTQSDAMNYPAHTLISTGPNYSPALVPKDGTDADAASVQVVAQRLAERDEALQLRLSAAEQVLFPLGSTAYQTALANLSYYSNQAFTASATVNTALAQVAQSLVDNAQGLAQNLAANNRIPWTGGDHTTLPNGAGDYLIMRGAEAGQVWTCTGNGVAAYRNTALEAVSQGQVDASVTLAVPSNKAITKQFFMLHHAPIVTPAFGLGNGTERLWDTLTNHRQLEPTTKGSYDPTALARLDALVDAYTAQGIDIIYCFGQMPNWATGNTSGGNAGSSYNNLPPTNPQDYADYCTFLANRYDGRIKYWEIWNEPNLASTFWSGTVAQLVTLHQVGYAALKTRNPANVVLSASPSGDQGGQGPLYLSQMLAAGAGAYFDVLSVHLYGEGSEPEARIENTARYRALMAQYGYGDKEIWDTESGYHDFKDWLTGQTLTSGMSEAQQFAYVARHHFTALAAGLSRTALYTATGAFGNIGLQDNAGTISNVGRLYQQLVTDLVGARVIGYSRSQTSVHTLTLTKNGVDWAYVWSPDRTAPKIGNNGDLGLTTVKRNLDAATGPEGDTFTVTPIPARVSRAVNAKARLSASLMAQAALYAEPASLNSLLRGTGAANSVPLGWSIAGSTTTITDYAGSIPKGAGRPITVTPTAQYGGILESIAEWLRPGDKYRVTVSYNLPVSQANEWSIWVTVGPLGGLTLPSIPLTQTGANELRTLTVEGVIPSGLTVSPDARLRLNYNLTSGFNPVNLFELRLDRLSAAPPTGITAPIRDRITPKYPASGSWRLAERARIIDTVDAKTYGEWLTCTKEGTFGTLSGVTVSGTAGGANVDITVTGGTLSIGDVVVFPGGIKRLTVTGQNPDGTYRMNGAPDVTVANGVLNYIAPVFEALASPSAATVINPAYTAQQDSTVQYARSEYIWKSTGATTLQAQMKAALELQTTGPGANTSWYLEHQDSTGATQRRWLNYDMSTKGLSLSPLSMSISSSLSVNGAGINLNAGAGLERNLYFMSNYAYRWSIRIGGGTEAGSSAGSDWQLLAIADGGGFSTAIGVTRATAFVNIGAVTPTERLHVSGNIKLSGVFKNAIYTKATLPSASASGNAAETFVSDPATGKGPIVYSNGTAWLYAKDDSAV
jgi:hypothetical protein